MTQQVCAVNESLQPIDLLKDRQGYRLEKAVPWGRSLHEYQQMFALTDADLTAPLVDVASGPSSFNAELCQRGHTIVSCDPLYTYAVESIEARFEEAYPQITTSIAACAEQYHWGASSPFLTVSHLGKERRRIARRFFQDYPQGKAQKRYLAASLPTLPFTDKQFRLALCSYFLFTYSDNFDANFHCDAVAELLRIADEVRIFPLFSLAGVVSPWLATVQQRFTTKLVEVPYHFQKGCVQFLRVLPHS